ncbi:enhancer of split M1 protein [Drosophila teissieri]|uniref:enhancer of split M1 protein n=1 Tax=Drosophila teissieri TaxID=7243 RepID=UPI001CBA2840|nr:enhancer of split M1 protein [Drosophila teissieri]
MHIFKLALVCFWFSFAESCETFCSRNFKPVCGYDGQCHTEAVNACQMKNINCQRAGNGKPVFKIVRRGACKSFFTFCKMLPED